MVAPPLLGHLFFNQTIRFFCSIDSHWLIDHVMIFQSSPIPGKLTIVNLLFYTTCIRPVFEHAYPGFHHSLPQYV